MATKTEEILDAIGEMSVLELSELVEQFKDKFNVTKTLSTIHLKTNSSGPSTVDSSHEVPPDSVNPVCAASSPSKVEAD